ncbi:hypothetical protein FB2170_11736 [Maribacter sp. HTCC2170]|nr:hypothetical protein FB2170_11736 [Maribacter sp. HTCC2170]
MTQQQQYSKICQTVLRKHYRLFCRKVNDPFFVDSEPQGRQYLTKMLFDTRTEVQATTYINRRDMNSRRIAERILSEYLQIGSKYGERYYKRCLKILEHQ